MFKVNCFRMLVIILDVIVMKIFQLPTSYA